MAAPGRIQAVIGKTRCDAKGVNEYQISVRIDGGNPYVVYRRFKEFVRLCSDLPVPQAAQLLPSKFFQTSTADRITKLDAFLKAVISEATFGERYPRPLLTFLGVEGVLEPLAPSQSQTRCEQKIVSISPLVVEEDDARLPIKVILMEPQGDNGVDEIELGELRAMPGDSLAAVRNEIYKQFTHDAIPLRFYFVVPQVDTSTTHLRCVEHPEEEAGIVLASCLTRGGSKLLLRSLAKTVAASNATDTASWMVERDALKSEIRALEAQLADTRHRLAEFVHARELARMERGQILASGFEGEKEVNHEEASPLFAALTSLRKEGFIATDVDLCALEEKYLAVFDADDMLRLFVGSPTLPLRFAWRRLCGDPEKMFRYVKALQDDVLLKYHIKKARLVSPFWTAVLRDVRFVDDPAQFAAWAAKEPWLDDDDERYNVLTSKYLMDASKVDSTLLLGGVSSASLERKPSLLSGLVKNTAEAALRSRGGVKLRDQTSTQSSSEEPAKRAMDLTKYRRMLDVGLPQGAVENAMRRDNVPVGRLFPSQDGAASLEPSQGAAPPADLAAELAAKSQAHRERLEAAPLSLRAVAPKACDNYTVDVLAAEFGTCLCGHARHEHAGFELSAHDHTAVMAENPTVAVGAPGAAVQRLEHPCDHFVLDLTAAQFEMCRTCGHSKVDHLFSHSGGGRHAGYKLEVRHAAELTPQATPCNHYTLALDASTYGACVCGHPKSAHSNEAMAHSSAGRVEVPPSHLLAMGVKESVFDSSEERAVKARFWVEDSIDRLLSVIELIGANAEEKDKCRVTFGDLFATYENVSDALVGILARAKKRGLVSYQGAGGGDILLQGRHDNVIIEVHPTVVEKWRAEVNEARARAKEQLAASS